MSRSLCNNFREHIKHPVYILFCIRITQCEPEGTVGDFMRKADRQHHMRRFERS